MKPAYHELEFNITCIDTEHMRKDFVSAYLIEHNGRAAFVDTGCYLSVPNLLATLKEKNIDPLHKGPMIMMMVLTGRLSLYIT